MAEYGCTAAINVTSNLNTGNGIPDYRLFKRYGIPVIIGNDSLGTNIASDIRNTMFGIHLRTRNPWWFGYDSLLDCVRNSYDMASRLLGVRLGRLEEGYEADFALVEYIPPVPLDKGNIWGHVVDGIFNNYRPKDLWCAGQAKMRDYRVTFDESAIMAETRISAGRAWKRMGL